MACVITLIHSGLLVRFPSALKGRPNRITLLQAWRKVILMRTTGPSFTSSEVGLLRICHVGGAEINPAPFYLLLLNLFEPECYPTQAKHRGGVTLWEARTQKEYSGPCRAYKVVGSKENSSSSHLAVQTTTKSLMTSLNSSTSQAGRPS